MHNTNQINLIPHEYRLTIGIDKLKVKTLQKSKCWADSRSCCIRSDVVNIPVGGVFEVAAVTWIAFGNVEDFAC